MILILIVGFYSYFAERVRITRTLTLTGARARVYGALLIALAIPMRLFLGYVLVPALPRRVTSDPLFFGAANVAVLVFFFLLPAFLLRDRTTIELAGTDL